MSDKLHSLFERLLGETDGLPKGDDLERRAARLGSYIGEMDEPGEDERMKAADCSMALLAAYLDGGLDSAKQADVHDRLSRSSAAFHDLAAADVFLDTVAARLEPAPPELATVIPVRTSAPAAAPKRVRPFWRWYGMAIALAAAVAAVIIVHRQTLPTDATTPVAAQTAPGPEGSGASRTGKEGASSSPPVVPAASEDIAPELPSTRARPAMAPEGLETMPGKPMPQK